MNENNPIDLGFLETSPKIKTERKRVLVAFGDLTGFSQWTQRPISSPDTFSKLMVKLYKQFIRFRNGNGYFVKLMGDGFMAVTELGGNKIQNRSRVRSILIHLHDLNESVQKLIKGITYPQPQGFRVRVVVGDALKLEAVNGRRHQIDYLSYPVNLASNLLDIRREIPCICHETGRELANGVPYNGRRIKFNRLKRPSVRPKGIDAEDLKALWSFRVS